MNYFSKSQLNGTDQVFTRLLDSKVEIKFKDMLKLIKKCDGLDYNPRYVPNYDKAKETAAINLLFGIFPGVVYITFIT